MSQLTVLLIEQDPSLQILYSQVLRDAGYDVYPLTHNDDVVQAADRCRPALALISGGHRGLFHAGWRAAEQLRALHPTLPLIMISTNSTAVLEVGRTRRGQAFVAALQKPFQLDDLLATIARWTPARSEPQAGDEQRILHEGSAQP
ncbi:MAG: response regulator [Pseudomonadota bacterium]|nr:response regulator [Chloroflexota bacterium]MDP9414610.1 response regulator [Pseudomonadota bacterium]